MVHAKPCAPPVAIPSKSQSVDHTPLDTATSYHLSYAVNLVSIYACSHCGQYSGCQTHFVLVCGTHSHGVLFQAGPMSLSAFANSDWAADPVDRQSTTGSIVLLGNKPIQETTHFWRQREIDPWL